MSAAMQNPVEGMARGDVIAPPSSIEPVGKPRSRSTERAHDPTVLTVGTLLVDFLDVGWIRSRRHVARSLTFLATIYLSGLSDLKPLLKIERAARNRRRFTRCYALDTLGRLGEFAKRTVWTQADGLASPDPFVREAAARALWRMGDAAIEARSQIISAIYLRVREGTARYGLLWLTRHNYVEEEINSVLEFVVNAKDSYARDEAKRLLERLSGPTRPDPQRSDAPDPPYKRQPPILRELPEF